MAGGRPKGQRVPELWVFPYDERKTDAYNKFLRSKAQANFRKEAWALTFDQWWALWESSGHWDNRNRDAGGYCMIMWDTDLGWLPDNVEIVSRQQALSTQRRRKKIKTDKKIPWTKDPLNPKWLLPCSYGKFKLDKKDA